MYKLTSSKMIITRRCLLVLSVVFASAITWVNNTNAATITADQWVNVTPSSDPLLDNLQNIPQDAHTKGMWSNTADWPLVSVHAMLLPNGKVLTYGTDDKGSFDGRYFDEWDPSKGMGATSHLTRFSHGYQNSFCSAAAYLPQGKLLISGGDTQRTSMLYTTGVTESEEPLVYAGGGANMSFDRWYATMITLPNGNPIIMGGMVPYKEVMAVEIENALNNGWASMTPEIYDPQTNSWTSLLGATSRVAFGPDYNRTSYPRAWVAPNGQVFGVSADKMWYMDTSGDGFVTDAGTFKGPYSSQSPVNVGSTNTAVMYDIGKILVTGGNGRVWFDLLPASNMATSIDINSGTPVLTEQPAMTYKRRFANATVLATGDVVVLGGTETAYKDDGAVFAAEIWHPNSQSWTLGANASVFRGYHSNATLLPNGTLLSHGGGFPDPVPGLSAQVYYPPYLFRQSNGSSTLVERPVIKAISGLSYEAYDPIQLDMESSDTIASLALMGVSNGTHAFNAGQRRIPISFTQEGIRLSASLPNYHLTPPGYYQVVAVDQNGVPSKGVIISIGNGLETPTIPTTPYTPPEISNLQLTKLQIGAQASYSIDPIAGVMYSWNFGDGTASTAYSADPSTTHSFNSPGVFVITLSANDKGVISTRTYLQAVLPNTTPTSNQPNASNQVFYETVNGGNNRLWAVNPDNDSISVINASSNSLIANISVGKQPTSVAMAPDGNVWAVNKQSASISVISASTLTVVDTINLEHASQPHGLAFSPNNSQAFITLEATGKLLKINTSTKLESGRVDLGSHIRHVSVNHDTSNVYVSRFITPPIPGESTASVNTSSVGGEVIVVDPATMTVKKTIKLQHSDKADTQIQGAGIPNYLGAVAISPDNTKAWVPSKQDNIKRGTLRSSFGLNFQNTVRAISSSINLSNLTENYAERIDHDNSSVATSAIYHPDGVYAFVTLETSREVAVLDAINGFELFKFDAGRAPQGIAISRDGKRLYVKDFMDRRVSIYDLTPLVDNGRMSVNNIANVYTVSLAQEKLNPSVMIGKQLFYDAKDSRLSKDSYMSCASCHDDGEHDGRVWDMTGFGEGLRNTISLKGKSGMGHGFLHWSANFDEIQDFEGQIRTLAGGTGLMSDEQFNAGSRSHPLGDTKAGISTELDELALYVSSLTEFDATPFGNANQALSTNAQAGKTVFDTNCISCHATEDKRTNSLNASTLRDIGTIDTATGKRLSGTITGLDVPTLRNLWQTAPYLHDGSALTISDAISQHTGFNLPANDKQNLVQYLLEIDNDSAAPEVPPTVSISAPVDGTTFAADENISITVNANDTDGSIRSVKLFNGDTLVDTETQAPFEFDISHFVAGTYSLTAQAVDDDDLVTTSNPVNITVEAVKVPPTITFTSPENNTSFTEGESVDLQVKASDSDGNVVSVSYYQGNDLIATVSEQPFNYSFTNLGVGNYTLHARALDNNGLATTSATIAITVESAVAPNVAPTIAISSPVNNSSFTAGESINLQVNTIDTDGSVASVSYYQGVNLIATVTEHPFSHQINNVTAGDYSITAKAADNSGAETTSSPINFSVKSAPVIDNHPPSISITSPATDAVYEEGSSVTLRASASDSDGRVIQVNFYDGSTLLGASDSAPYQYTVNSLTNNSHTFTAKALDNVGLEAISSSISITVTASQGKTPVVKETVEDGIVTPKFQRTNNNGQVIEVTPTKYTGPVTFLEYQLLGDDSNDVVIASDSNDFINLLGGSDAANGGRGNDVLDGGTGSNFLTGGEGNDTFFIDGRGNETTWSTITDLTIGDTANLWGYIEGTSKLIKIDSLNGAEGYKGITYHYDLNNDGVIETSITFSGKTDNSNIVIEAKTVNGESPYLLFYIAENSSTKKAAKKSYESNSDQLQNTVSSGNTATPPSTVIHCANEYEYCTVPEGRTTTVWYGVKGGQYIQKSLSGKFRCVADTFGGIDPNIGLLESCSYQ